jgi:hypothetical protein
MKLSFATIVLTLAAAVPATAQTSYYNGLQERPGYTDTRPNQAPTYGVPSGVGSYMTQTPGQSPTYGVPSYGVGGYTAQRPPGYINRQGR